MEALKQELETQVTALFVEGRVDAPHAYVQVWVGLRKYQERAGWRPLPGPGGWLDQDAELMWALEECDRVWGQLDADRAGREAAQAALAAVIGTAPNAPAAPSAPAPSPNGAGKTPFRLSGAFE